MTTGLEKLFDISEERAKKLLEKHPGKTIWEIAEAEGLEERDDDPELEEYGASKCE